MTAGRTDRWPVKIKRRGRHTSPSQVEKVAQQAGKAAPAVAIAGALVAAPHMQHAFAASARPATVTAHRAPAASTGTGTGTTGTGTKTATLDSFATQAVTVASSTTARHAALVSSTHYTVQSGDSLSGIAERYYSDANDWQYLYHENDTTISDPNLIYPGQSLVIPASVPAGYTLSGYVPKHAAPAQPATQDASTGTPAATTASPVVTMSSQSSQPDQSSQASQGSEASGGSGSATTAGSMVAAPAAYGDYSCSGLEQLWDQAGGNPADAFMAAEIAMAESSGNPNAISPTDDYGLWQINAVNGSLATLNPQANAQSAVTLSDDGTNWNPWTTYTSGAYSGKC